MIYDARIGFIQLYWILNLSCTHLKQMLIQGVADSDDYFPDGAEEVWACCDSKKSSPKTIFLKKQFLIHT